jgi:hypothetical protein
MDQDSDDMSSVGSGEGMCGSNQASESEYGSPGPFKAGLAGTQMYNQAEPVIESARNERVGAVAVSTDSGLVRQTRTRTLCYQ